MDSTLLKGLVVLERAVAAGEPVSVTSLARELGLPKSGVHRSLATLREAGYLLYSDEDRRYYPSLKVVQMAQRIESTFPYRMAVMPSLDRLVAATGEFAHLVVLDGASAVFVANSVPKVTVASVIPDNLALPWYDTAFGIAAACTLPPEKIATLLRDPAVSRESAAQAEAARTNGHVVFPSVRDRGTFEIALPIRTNWNTAVGAIGISGPMGRLGADGAQQHLEAIERIAAEAFDNTMGALTDELGMKQQ